VVDGDLLGIHRRWTFDPTVDLDAGLDVLAPVIAQTKLDHQERPSSTHWWAEESDADHSISPTSGTRPSRLVKALPVLNAHRTVPRATARRASPDGSSPTTRLTASTVAFARAASTTRRDP